jgi:IS5 family transposase
MNSFQTWGLREAYKKVEELGDKLSKISELMDWEVFRPVLDDMYNNKTEKGGRPNFDVILMLKVLLLQQWYSLSDMEAERQIADRISFMKFLGYPNSIPDSRTIWLFRERLAETGKDKIIWKELQRQLDAEGLQVKRGAIQDATFILSRLILENPRNNYAVITLRHVVVEMEPGPRKAMNSISVINCIQKWISITA